jgi:hypothetical protein
MNIAGASSSSNSRITNGPKVADVSVAGEYAQRDMRPFLHVLKVFQLLAHDVEVA